MKTLGIAFLLALGVTIFESLAEYFTGFEFHPNGYKLVTYSNELLIFVCGIIYAWFREGTFSS